MQNIHCIDIHFEAQQYIRSLPVFHGARWSAWLRFACSRARLCMDELICALLPLRNGTATIMPNENLVLRLIVPASGLPLLPHMVRAMQELPPKGMFCHRSLQFAGFREAVGDMPLTLTELTQNTVLPLTVDRLADRIASVQQWTSWKLYLCVPLRLTLPPGEKRGAHGVHRFCDAQFFRQDNALSHLLQHVRLLPPAMCGRELHVQDVRLRWEDMRYNRERSVALGGLIGELSIKGRPDAETARRLVLGEYLGAGKNGRFGLGFWRLAASESGLCPES